MPRYKLAVEFVSSPTSRRLYLPWFQRLPSFWSLVLAPSLHSSTPDSTNHPLLPPQWLATIFPNVPAPLHR